MKIIDKIVTSVTQPQLTSVMWHNPDTGEFKIFGGKGWEPAGGNPGSTGSSFSGGYPVVTVENDFNIEALPNTFYDIRNTKDTVINIEMDTNIYSTYDTNQSYYCFSGEGFEMVDDVLFSLCGISIISDSSIEGFKYIALAHAGVLYGQDIEILLSDLPTNGGTITIRKNTEDENSDVIVSNIVLNDIGEYVIFALIDRPDTGVSINIPIFIHSEVESDRDDYKYKYEVGGIMLRMLDGNAYIYTNDPYVNATVVVIPFSTCSGEEIYEEVPITVEHVKTIIDNNLSSINEFVFNFNSPTSINFNQVINWDSGNIPDLTKNGIYTFSILNGVGCYTFYNG